MPLQQKFHYTIKIYCRDGRYRVIWTDLQTQAYPSTYDLYPTKYSADYSLKNPYKKDGYTPYISSASQKEEIITTIERLNKTIEQTMSKSVSIEGIDDDW